MGINLITELEQKLQIKIFETQLQMEAVPYDVFDFREGVYSTEEEKPIPDELYLKLSDGANKGRTVQVPYIKALAEAPTLGARGDQRGNEEEPEVLSFDMYYNDFSHAVPEQEYGILARDKEPYQIFEKTTPLLSMYCKEYMGKCRRMAALEGSSENLWLYPHNGTVVPRFNSNFFIPNTRTTNQPVYVDNETTWVQRLAAAIAAAGTGANASISIDFVIALEEYAASELIMESFNVKGADRYIYLVPSNQCAWWVNPNVAGSAGDLWRDVTQLTKEEASYPGVLGRYRRTLIIEDNRYPTLSLLGSPGAYSLVARYRAMGRKGILSDPRDKTLNGRDVGMFFSPRALCHWMPENYHFESEWERYDKDVGRGVFASYGVRRVEWRNNLGTFQNEGSIMTPFAKPPASSRNTG